MHRLNHQITKIGVFGTFSAGKSSLINALLGGQYLVSSPNPTTAATTELSYGDESQITLKSADQLLEEINNVLEYYDTSFDSLEAFIHSDLKKLKAQLEKNQLAFINAVEQHYDMYLDMLNEGEVHTVSQDDVKNGVPKTNMRHSLRPSILICHSNGSMVKSSSIRLVYIQITNVILMKLNKFLHHQI